ncbi:U6 small nuclear RNA (adenine-(43)-N(6))-methyltransferase [Leguminivora glycinivorella]|uniref:U6 small nuclear RNA (adenine-(43)-N(6))-methyltransferase n=1 Tax=Leguminivora glycinivorella TaxID=1035111 RepID=UPI0020100569|nr:U6 small nuclear RNA (adenine-(43)-N(6))-methyltransferase [Leguminivora glycinivorella]
MAMNRYMHPRNIYKNPPDFSKLSKDFSEFSSICKTDVSGKVTIDFKDPHSLRVLTRCLLKSDFNLDVKIPEDRLVPTLPLRLNYLLWIEDLIKAIKRTGHIKGLDIGTGACAIYPLLATAKNKWSMLGTENDEESLSKALENVQQNNLQDFIQLKLNKTQSIYDFLFTEDSGLGFDFSMCNPPFYSNIQELLESRSTARPPPKNGFTGSPHELITDGGELEFCRKMIQESKNHKKKVILFTTMVGHKFTLNELSEDLKAEGIKYTSTEFCQGRVTRWGLAWTYQDYNIYKLVPPRDKPRKKIANTVYQLPELSNSISNVDIAFDKLKPLLLTLKISRKVLNKKGNCILLDIIATENTWSNQRRKRRMLKREDANDAKKLKQDCSLEAETVLENNNSEEKPIVLENACSSIVNGCDDAKTSQLLGNTEVDKGEQQLVHAFLKLFLKDGHIFLETEFLDGASGKEGLHQIIQYIKNNWK